MRARKVGEEIALQRRVWIICFVDASHGARKALKRVKVVRGGKRKHMRRIRERFRRLGRIDKGRRNKGILRVRNKFQIGISWVRTKRLGTKSASSPMN